MKQSKFVLNLFLLNALLLSLLGYPFFVTPARAAGFTVTKVADTADGACNADCSLREAIIAANAIAGADTIFLPPGTYTLTRAGVNENASATGDLDISSVITISGTGKGTKIIQAATTAGAGIDRVFHVVSGTLVLNDLTVKNGRAPGGANGVQCGPLGPCPSTSDGKPGQSGGGIFNAGTLTLNRVTVTNNWAGNGGKAGNLVCTLLGPQCSNEGGDGGNGGGIFSTGNLTINNSTFSNNRSGNGGAIGTETCASVCHALSGIGGDGGGVFNGGTTPVTVTASTFSSNSGDTGITCSGPTLCFSGGGAIFNKAGSTLTVTDSIFSGNHASFGGAFLNEGTASITGSTFTSSSATVSGGGIFNGLTLTIANSTFLNNIGANGGLFNSDRTTMTVINSTLKDSDFFNGGLGTLNLFNSILSSDNSDIDCFNAGGGSKANNLAKASGSTACGMTNGANGNIIGPDPNLGALIGSPAFFPLNIGSLAIDTGSDAKCTAAPVSSKSQNGLTRPQGVHCDMGSFERDLTPPTVLSSVRSNPNPTAAATVGFTVSFSEAVSGVDLTDFSLTSSGVIAPFLVSVSGSGSTRTVIVNTGSGSGSIRLNVLDDNTIKDAALNALNGAFNSGQVYTIDKTLPVVGAITCANASPTDAASVGFTLSFSEAVTGVDVADLNLASTGIVGASITGLSGSGATYTITANTGSGNGAMRLDVRDGATVFDGAGNALTGLPYIFGCLYTVDKGITQIFDSVGANDGLVVESGEDTNAGGALDATSVVFKLGDNAANRQIRSILHFDTSSLPDTAIIDSVVVEIKQQGLVGIDPFTTHGSLRVDIGKPAFDTAALEISDFQAAPSAPGVAAFNVTPINGVYSASLNAVGISNINLIGTTQLRLRFLTDDDNDLTADFMQFFSGDSTPANRPHLVITYHLP